MKKKTTKAFGKNIYLLGRDAEGTNYWLEEPTWDCDWYWGFGYIETYTNNANPKLAKDILSHQHFDSLFLSGKQNAFNEFKDFFAETPLTDDEIYELVDYMKTFYTLQKAAEVFRHGYSWQTARAKLDALKDESIENKINKTMLPALFERIKKLLGKEN